MIRFFYFAVAALTLAVCIEHALAQCSPDRQRELDRQSAILGCK